MRIAILGGGISGLVAAHVLSHASQGKAQIALFESSRALGGSFALGGLKYIADTPSTREMLVRLGILYECQSVVGAVWDGNEAHHHTSFMSNLGPVDRLQIQTAHWDKTRGSLEGFRADCMNDPESLNKRALACDIKEFIKKMAWDASVHAGARVGVRVTDVGLDCIATSDGLFTYDVLVNTLPLGIIKRLSRVDIASGIPDARARKLLISDVFDVDVPMWWDYLYTPFAPKVSRITKNSIDSVQIEMPFDGCCLPSPTTYDLEPLMRGGRNMLTIKERCVIDGHLMPLHHPIRVPKNWLMLGRYAEWDPRSTVDKALDKVTEWSSKHV